MKISESLDLVKNCQYLGKTLLIIKNGFVGWIFDSFLNLEHRVIFLVLNELLILNMYLVF